MPKLINHQQEKSNSVIYQIRHKNKIYIGSAVNFKTRKSRHLHQLKINKHHNNYLQNVFNKYGKECLEWSVLENVENKENLIEAEQKWIDKFKQTDRLINISKTAGSKLGTKCSESTKKKISMGNKGKICSEYVKQLTSNRSKGNKYNLGRKNTPETKAKISTMMKGKNNGEKSGHSKLKEYQVIEIKNKFDTEKICNICKFYGVSDSTIQDIKSGRTWKHISSIKGSDLK